ncbi:hypothetical protein ACIRVF_31685 [Kitasatospora sp. NPDC101157]|uniref:hypothetical protein n=1 Tax=Kitasatospora sp. NPDC101157 TaxID=3364098 RepID=UPI00380F5FD5
MNRESLERLRLLLAARIGAPHERGEDAGRVEPLRRQVHHALTGIDAYLTAVDTGSCTAVGLRERAQDLWNGLERIASTWPEQDTVPAAADGPAQIPAQPSPPA